MWTDRHSEANMCIFLLFCIVNMPKMNKNVQSTLLKGTFVSAVKYWLI